MEKKFISPTEVSEALNVSARIVNKLVRAGRLRSYNFAGKIRIDEDDFKNFLQQCLQSGGENNRE